MEIKKRGEEIGAMAGSEMERLVLAALNGERSLRGMWLWGRSHWEQIVDALGLAGTKGAPAYGRVWGLLAGLDSEELSKALSGQAQEGEDGYTIDGKKLRGANGLQNWRCFLSASPDFGLSWLFRLPTFEN